METTSRFAKIIGPGIMALLNQIVPMIHYFTVNAVSFFISALSLQSLKTELPYEPGPVIPGGWKNVKSGLTDGFALSQSNSLIHFVIWTDAAVNAGWFFIFPLAVGLLLHERMPDNISALSFLVSAFGFGNVAANVVLAHLSIKAFRSLSIFWQNDRRNRFPFDGVFTFITAVMDLSHGSS